MTRVIPVKVKSTCSVCNKEFTGNRYGSRLPKTCSDICQKLTITGRPRTSDEHRAAMKELQRTRERARTADAGHRDRRHDLYLRRNFGMSKSDYDELLRQQDGRCAICGSVDPGNGRGKRPRRYFAVDHCHATGSPRGLLCVSCNTGIGNLGDDPMLAFSAMKYLEHWRILPSNKRVSY